VSVDFLRRFGSRDMRREKARGKGQRKKDVSVSQINLLNILIILVSGIHSRRISGYPQSSAEAGKKSANGEQVKDVAA
jgi:hypothetical protein